MKRTIPWWAKIAAKVILSRLPVDYRALANAGMFRHGHMDREDYALGEVRRHLAKAGLEDLRGMVCVELGPGDAVSSALVAHAFGAKHCYLIDDGAYASKDMDLYRSQAHALSRAGYEIADVSSCGDIESLLKRIGGMYLTDGLKALQGLDTDSIDFIWSHAVLEHVRLGEFDATL